MHVARNKRRYTAKSGEERCYETVLLRRSFRDGDKIRHETLANLSKLPPEVVAAVDATVKGRTLVADDDRAGAPAVAMISYEMWQRQFAGGADVIGSPISVERRSAPGFCPA